VDQLLLLDQNVKPEHRSGWKDSTKEITFSSMTAPQKKGLPSTRKRDKPMICSPEGDEISYMLSCKREEKLYDLMRDTT